MPEIDGVRLPFLPLGGVGELQKQGTSKSSDSISTFDSIFQDEINKVKFSAHAQTRLASRDITLNDEDLTKIQNAVSKAEAKGANESLILLNGKAFIVNIANKTVITVLNQEQMNENVITNIDSAVFA